MLNRHAMLRLMIMQGAATIAAIAVLSFEVFPISGWGWWSWWQANGVNSGAVVSRGLIQKASSINCNRNNNSYMFYCNCYYLKQDDDRIITSNSGKDRRLTHSNFRIEQDVLRALTRAAEKRGMTLSGLVNRTLKNYVTSEMYFEELGFILVSKKFLRKTFEGLDRKHVEELGKEYGLTMAEEYISYFYPQINSNTLISFLQIWFRRFQSCQYRVEDNDDDDATSNKSHRHCFRVGHDINMNFSLSLQSMLVGLIEPIVKSIVEFSNVTANTITFSFNVDD